MEGYSGDESSEKKKDDKSEKKAGKAAGLGSRTFELANKKDAAEKIAESKSIWDKLIPKDGGEKAKEDSLLSTPEAKPDDKPEAKSAERADAESAEEAPDPSVETLTDGEKAEVIKDYAQEKTSELEAGRSDAEDPAEAAAREANIEFLKQVEADAEATPLEPVEEVAEPTPESTDAESPEAAEEEQAESEHGPAELAHDEAIELNVYEPTVEAPEDDHEEDEDTTQQTAHAAAMPLATNPVLHSAAAGNPSNQPPRGPAGPGMFTGGPNFNAMPADYTPNTAPTTAESNDLRNEATYFLAGGIIGYLLGRRRGRIKTEKRMRVVTKKLEKQIKETRDQVLRQETAIRQQARDRYNEAHRPRGAETTAARTETKVQPETITDYTRTESKASNLERQATAERVQHMNNAEVMAMAEKIVIDGTNLRTMFEAKQITEPGLRRITLEYLTGGDIKKALQQELKVKEMQYERDPQMRDRLAASYAGVDAAQPQASNEALASLLAQNKTAATNMHTNVDPGAAEAEAAKNRSKQVLISAWAALVVVLVIVAVVLAMR